MKQEEQALRKLSRAALLELLVEQSRELDRLREQCQALEQENARLEDTIRRGSINPRDATLVAAAALKIHQMLETAQRVADGYAAQGGKRE